MEMTKIEMVLNHLIQNKIISQKVAAAKYDCWRLSSIIFDLRRYGIDIKTLSKKGKPCCYYLKLNGAAEKLANNYLSQRIEAYEFQRHKKNRD